MKLKTVRDVDVKNKRVLVRVDYNVSMGQGLRIVDDTRIKHTIPTIEYLLERNATVFLCSHLGRPGGKKDSKYSLKPVAKHLSGLMEKKIKFVEEYLGENGEEVVSGSSSGEVYLLENTRFHPGEKKNDPKFARELAKFGELYVDDAFGTAHRAHASVVGVAEFLPSVAGLSLRYEVETILKAIDEPEQPLCVIVGGSKVSDKIGLLRVLIKKADVILIGGAMANTFLLAQGYEIGDSVYEREVVDVARDLIELADKEDTKMLIPKDVVLGNLKTKEHNGVVRVNNIPKDMQALDIGPETQAIYGAEILKAKTVIWNGPMGVFEKEQFVVGSDFIFHTLTQNEDAFVVVGGGDTLAAIQKQEHLERIDHISTGGGAMLELIEKGTLPGIEVLQEKE